MRTPPPVKLRYECDLDLVREDLRPGFIPLQPDSSTAAYLARAERRRLSRMGLTVRRILGFYLSDYDIDGILNTYPMHLASAAQWETLLGPARGGRLLDIGAGSGDITHELAQRFDTTHVTETAPVLAWRLRRRGFTVHLEDVTERAVPAAPYDAVSLLNVLDRCRRPRALLASAVAALRPSGHLIVAVPLPYRPVAYDGPYLVESVEPLHCAGTTWETALNSLVEQNLEPAGLSVTTWTRLPYLAGSDAHHELTVYDDVLVVCRQGHQAERTADG